VSPRPPRFLLLAGDVASNLGDRAIRAALVNLIRARHPDARFTILSRTPERDAREFGASVLGRSAAALVTRAAAAARVDAAIWGGGQLLQDDSSLVKNLYWAVVLGWVRRVLRLPILGWGVGVGPIGTGVGRFFAARALANLSSFTGRDARSAELVRELTRGRVPVAVAPDLASFLRSGPPPPRPPEAAGRVVVGVALRRWFHLRPAVLPYAVRARGGAEDPRFARLLENVAEALRAFGAARPAFLALFPMGTAAWEGDESFLRRVAERAGLPHAVVPTAGDAASTKAALASCDLLLSMRMHPSLLALSAGVPALGVAHVPKVGDLFAEWGQADGAIPVEAAAAPDGAARLASGLEGLWMDRDDISRDLRRRAALVADAAERYLGTLDGILGRPAA
jgi:polysaccharide pyruvyl transferase WcaK-like protein